MRGLRWSGIRASMMAALAIAPLALWSGPVGAQEDHSGLTRETYRKTCLLCHSKAAPEGVAPWILEGLRPVPGLKPADAMPGVTCWRRCEICKGRHVPEAKR